MTKLFLILVMAHIPFNNAVHSEEFSTVSSSAISTARTSKDRTPLSKNRDSLTIVAVGDVLLARKGIEYHIKMSGEKYPFEKIGGLLKSADISFCNMECSLSDRGEPLNKQWQLRGSPKRVESLKYAGFDVVNLANNHTMDFGELALLDTIRYLNENKILAVGAGRDIEEATAGVIIPVGEIRVGFLGYSAIVSTDCIAKTKKPGVAPTWPAKLMKESIKKLKARAHIVFVSFHWGEEKSYYPTKSQKYLARHAIDSGADIVVGHHPHVMQGIEFYKNKPIVYSLGNFVFMPPKDEQNETIIVEFMLRISTTDTNTAVQPASDINASDINASALPHAAIEGITIYPVYIHSGQPRIAPKKRAEKILTLLKELCSEMKTKMTIDKNYKYANVFPPNVFRP
ncbi:MAG: CapA family protein [Elusimicrobiota bacterium]